jgi:adenylate cyclase
VRSAVGKKLPLDYESMGEQQVKNIEEPVRAYRVRLEAQTASPSSTPSAGVSAKPSLAVLPFTNMSGDPQQEYFSDGITEEITTALSNMGWFSVTARHSAFAYKGKAVDVRQVGKELGVQYILEGSVRKAGDKIRVTAQLIETATGQHIWANRYDGTVEDIFDFQDQITATILSALEPEFERVEGERVSQKRPENMEAYDYLLRGLSYLNKLTPEDTRTALPYFRKAIEKDPGYGRAYAYAFWCYRRQVMAAGLTLPKQEQAEAIRLIEAGLKADEDDPLVLWQASTMKCLFQRDFEGALALIDRSLAHQSSQPEALGGVHVHGRSASPRIALRGGRRRRQESRAALRLRAAGPSHSSGKLRPPWAARRGRGGVKAVVGASS